MMGAVTDIYNEKILFIGSLQDDMCRKDILEEYTEMKKLVKHGDIHTFDTGGHPAIATNGEKFADIVLNFLVTIQNPLCKDKLRAS